MYYLAIISICALLAAIICFIPTYSHHDLSGIEYFIEVPLKTALTSDVFEHSLVASIAAAFPMTLELLADSFTTGLSFESANHASVLLKWVLLAALMIPNFFFLTLIGSTSYYLIPMIFLSRQIILFATWMLFLGYYGHPIWTRSNTIILTILFAIGQVIEIFEAFSYEKWSQLKTLRFVDDLIFSIFLLFVCFRWLNMIHKKVYIEKTKLTVNEYYCTGHLLAMLIGFVGLWTLYILYSKVPWAETDGVYLASLTYVETAYTVLLGLWNGRISRTEFAVKQVHQELETKRMFVRYVSHEIRTPLNTVMMGLKLLETELSALENNIHLLDTVGDISTSVDTAVNILNDLLTYEKLSANILTLELAEVAIKKFIHAVIRPFFLQARESGIELHISFIGSLRPEDIEIFLSIDKSKVAQVVRNLVSNALKFSKRGDHVRIVISREKGKTFQTQTQTAQTQSPQTQTQTGDVESAITVSAVGNEALSPPLPLARSHSNDALGVGENQTHEVSSILSNDIRPSQATAGSPTNPFPEFTSARSRMRGYVNDMEANRVLEEKDSFEDDRTAFISGSGSGSVGVSGDVGWLRIDVIDQGPGIAVENQNRLFNEIIQFNPGELQDGKGSGIGLWISSRIVDLHGGGLSMQSGGLGCGCTFTLTLPIVKIVQTPVAVTEHPIAVSVTDGSSQPDTTHTVQERVEDPSSSVMYSSSQATRTMLLESDLLLVDDAPLNRKFLRKLLAKKCRSIREAEDGALSLELIRSSIAGNELKVDLLIVDYQMPVMDGPTAVKAMRAAGYDGIVIGLTGNAHPNDIQYFLSCGADRVLIKPLRFEELESTLEDILVERRGRMG